MSGRAGDLVPLAPASNDCEGMVHNNQVRGEVDWQVQGSSLDVIKTVPDKVEEHQQGHASATQTHTPLQPTEQN